MKKTEAIQFKLNALSKVVDLLPNAPEGSLEDVLLKQEMKEIYTDLLGIVQDGYDNADYFANDAIENYNDKNGTNLEEKDFNIDELFGDGFTFFNRWG